MHFLPDSQSLPLSFDCAAPVQAGHSGPALGVDLLNVHWLAFDEHAQHAQALNQAVGLGLAAPHLSQDMAVTRDMSVRLLAPPSYADDEQWPGAMTLPHVTTALSVLRHTQAQLLLVCTYDSEAVHVWCVPRLSMPDCGEAAVRAEHAMAASRVSWAIGKRANAPSKICLEAIGLATRLLWLVQCMRAQQAAKWAPELLSAVLQCEAVVGAASDKDDSPQRLAPLHAMMAQAWLSLMQFDAAYTPQAMRAMQAWAQQTHTLSDPLWRARAATLLAHAHLLRGVRGQEAGALLASANTLVHAEVAALRVRDRLAWGLLHWHCAQAFEALWLMRRSQGWADLPQLLDASSDEAAVAKLDAHMDTAQNSAASVSWLRQGVAAFEQAVRVFPATCAVGLWARLARGRTTQALGRAVSDQGVLMLATRVLDHLQVPPLAVERHLAAQDVAVQVPLLMGEAFASLARLRRDKVQMVLALQQFEVAIACASNEPLAYASAASGQAWASAQHGVGTCLLWLAQYDSSEAQHSKYERGVAAFKAALTRRRLSSAPVDWSHTQAALGRAHALWSRAKPVGQQACLRDGSQHMVQHLEQAIAAYGLALSAPHTLGFTEQVQAGSATPDDHAASASGAHGFVRAQLLAELGGVWLALGRQTSSAVAVQASIDCLNQALRETALPNSNLRVLLHNNVAAAYKQLSLIGGELTGCVAACEHYAQAWSLLQTSRMPVSSWLPVASNWTNAALRAQSVPNAGLAWALSWPSAPIGAAVAQAFGSTAASQAEHTAWQIDTVQTLVGVFNAVLRDEPDCALAHWQLARLQAVLAALAAQDAIQQRALVRAVAHGQALRELLLADAHALAGISEPQLSAWLHQVAVVHTLCQPSLATAATHEAALNAAVEGFQAGTQQGAPVWRALSLRVLAAVTDKAQPRIQDSAGISDALHHLWQVDSQHAARLERVVTYAEAACQRWQGAVRQPAFTLQSALQLSRP